MTTRESKPPRSPRSQSLGRDLILIHWELFLYSSGAWAITTIGCFRRAREMAREKDVNGEKKDAREEEKDAKLGEVYTDYWKRVQEGRRKGNPAWPVKRSGLVWRMLGKEDLMPKTAEEVAADAEKERVEFVSIMVHIEKRLGTHERIVLLGLRPIVCPHTPESEMTTWKTPLRSAETANLKSDTGKTTMKSNNKSDEAPSTGKRTAARNSTVGQS